MTVGGMSCSACSTALEAALGATEGVAEASVNLLTSKAEVSSGCASARQPAVTFCHAACCDIAAQPRKVPLRSRHAGELSLSPGKLQAGLTQPHLILHRVCVQKQ
jgi:copper chaperone CopZ